MYKRLGLVLTQSHIQINKQLSIPLYELTFRFSRSGGPGGQHVNRSETRVELLFDVEHSPSLDQMQREKVLARLGHMIDKNGVLRLVSEESRSQHQNRESVIARFQNLMQGALRPRKKRQATRPSRAAKQKRMDEKRRQSQKKRGRSTTDW